MTAAPALIQIESVSRDFRVGEQTIHALRDVSFDVASGDFVAVIGRSGSGKTTLLNVIAGLDRPNAGRVVIEGADVTAMTEEELTELRRRKLGFVFQSFGLLPLLSAWENVELALRIAGAAAKDRAERTAEVLELVGLTRRAKHRPYELSGGEQQRVAIARALANRPRIVLADEPTGELDSMTALSIFNLLVRVVETEGVTIVTTTHDRLVMERARRVLELSDGELLSEARTFEQARRDSVSIPLKAAEGILPRREKDVEEPPEPESEVEGEDDRLRWARPEQRKKQPFYQPPRSPREM